MGISQEYTALSKAMDLPQQRQRVTVDGLGNIGVGKYKNILTTNENKRILKEKIKNGDISLIINSEKQNPHIFGANGYNPSSNKSYFTVSIEELQEILNNKSGTGEITVFKNGQIKETIQVEKDIGIVIGMNGENLGTTNTATIHYSNKRTHIVPKKKRGVI